MTFDRRGWRPVGRVYVGGAVLLGAAFLGTCAEPAHAGDPELTSIRVATGLVNPIFVVAPPDDFERVFIIEQPGAIRILMDGVVLATPFLDLDPFIAGGTEDFDERGLLGLAFHPDYQSNGLFYVNYTDNHGDTAIVRHQVSPDPNLADTHTRQVILTIDQPFENHNGGWMDFGLDGYLYIATGDGGDADDPGNRAQDITQLLGKLLRIDVDADDFPDDPERHYAIPPSNPFVGVLGADEIWAYGLRNPWRCSFDRMTGELYIADVGQGDWEEINVEPAGAVGGANYGWRCMEGSHCTGSSGCACHGASLTLPIQEYGHNQGCSITGGYVYRGCAIPGLEGTYFYADYCAGTIWTFRYVDGAVTDFQNRTVELAPDAGSIAWISSFGVDAYGSLYLCDRFGGEVFKVVAATVAEDCNENGAMDACDILDETSDDANGNGIPDECETAIAIIAADPPDGAIDARQPWGVDGEDPSGWSTLELTFDGNPSGLTPADFGVSQTGGVGPAPDVIAVTPLGADRVTVTLATMIEPCAWTTVTHLSSGTAVRLGYLPGDVTADRISASLDILALIDALNGVGDPRAAWSTDINRSGLTEPSDVLREIDLLNHIGAYAPLCSELPDP